MPASKFEQPNYNTDTGTVYPLKIDSDFNVFAQTGVDYAPRAQDTPNMTVSIEAGSLFTASGLVSNTLQTTPTIVAPTSPNNRIDRVVIVRTTGVLAVVTGTPAVSPVAPAIPADRLPICQFTLTPTTTTITNEMITDERTFTVGVGSMAFQNSSAVAITGGAATLGDLAVGGVSRTFVGAKHIDIGNAGSLFGFESNNANGIYNNLRYDGTSFRYIIDGFASAIDMEPVTGNVRVFTCPSGLAGAVATLDEKVRVASVGDFTVIGDIKAYRAATPNTGVVYLNVSGDRFLFYNGTNYELNGANLTINGGTAWHSANDGTGSGLDADLLRGISGASYWHSANDGTGSGLDADLLRGISGAEYRHNTNTFHGRVNGDGSVIRLPSGWSSAKFSTGSYFITHNLGTANYSVIAMLNTLNGTIRLSTKNTTEVWFNTTDLAGVSSDRAFELILMKDWNDE